MTLVAEGLVQGNVFALRACPVIVGQAMAYNVSSVCDVAVYKRRIVQRDKIN